MTSKEKEYLAIFDSLPDTAVCPTKITALVTGLSERTVRYHPQLERKYVSADRYGQGVGDVRKLLRDGVTPQPTARKIPVRGAV